jgi:hypothetical protein
MIGEVSSEDLTTYRWLDPPRISATPLSVCHRMYEIGSPILYHTFIIRRPQNLEDSRPLRKAMQSLEKHAQKLKVLYLQGTGGMVQSDDAWSHIFSALTGSLDVICINLTILVCEDTTSLGHGLKHLNPSTLLLQGSLEGNIYPEFSKLMYHMRDAVPKWNNLVSIFTDSFSFLLTQSVDCLTNCH